MEAIVDRVKGGVAVLELEGGRHVDAPLSELAENRALMDEPFGNR